MNKLPVIGWALSTIGAMSLSVPFWICWTKCGIGETFFNFLPEQYHSIGFWNCVGLFIVIGILKGMVPTFITSSSTSNNTK